MNAHALEQNLAEAVDADLAGNVIQFRQVESQAEKDAGTMADFFRARAAHHETRIAERKRATKQKVADIDAEIARLTATKARLRAEEKRDNAADKKIADTLRANLSMLEAE